MPASPVSTGAGQAAVFEPKHAPDLVSQHCTPPARAGQLFWQSLSSLQDGTHFLATGGVVDAGGTVEAGGSVSAVSWVGGTSALLAQAVATRIAVTANADFEKVEYVTAGTLRDGF